MGYVYANDDDDAAGWLPHVGASSEAWNDAAFWIRMLQDAKARGLRPSEALNEMSQATNPRSHIVQGSRTTSVNLDALRALAGR